MEELRPVHCRAFIFAVGCVIIPLILCSTLLWIGFSERNLSGLLSEPSFFPFVHIAFFMMLGWLLLMLYIISGRQRKIHAELILLAVLISGALCIGYKPDSPAMQSVHLILSYGAFAYMNLLFYRTCGFYVRERNIYLSVCFCALLISFTAGVVSGISEVLYGSCCSILLTLIALKNIK